MNEEIVRIERPVYGGSGLAKKHNGAVAFVPFSLPGELVEIEASGSRDEASLLRVVEPSSERVAARCPHFGVCGGCHYQHANYESQLALKHTVLRETLERAAIRELPAITVRSAEPWEYRNRVRFRLEAVEGELRCGYSIRGSNEFLPIVTCPISAPSLLRAMFGLLELSKEDSAVRSWLTVAKEAEWFTNESLSGLNMTLFVSAKGVRSQADFTRLCEVLRQKRPELTGASAVLMQDNRASPRLTLREWGASGLAYRAAGETYWITRGGFFQVNRFLVDELVQTVCAGRGGELAWDLYAGVGLFSRVLARSYKKITAVEANPTAVADLRSALAKLGDQHTAVQASTVAFLNGALLQRDRPELIVLDPPRAGAGLEVCSLLGRLRPKEIAYVSCDPTTLARDLSALQNHYAITAITMVDLFPQTYHLESVVVLRRK